MARRLGPDEKALWGRVIETVRPLHPVAAMTAVTKVTELNSRHPALDAGSRFITGVAKKAGPRVKHGVTDKNVKEVSQNSLDSHWDRRIHKGAIIPDISVDLHETTLSGAYARLDRTLDQAIHQKLKVVLLVTGKVRAHDRASGTGRGAIAAVVRDWLAASRHAGSISAVRQAHPRHGGSGALYIVLKR
jgi:DNA-nicking Smr family endonuclease